VIVGTDQQVNVVAAQAVISRDGVGTDLFEGVTEVRFAVRVLDGRGDVGITRIETPASGAAHSIGGVGGRERGDDAAIERTTRTRAHEQRLRHRANAMRAEGSRQAVRHRGGVRSLRKE
jgi:hypothetical protein